MKLFFETAGQAHCFLMMTPVGFALALLLDVNAVSGFLRPLADLAAFVLAGAAWLMVVTAVGESGLRLYQFLGLAAGAVLYLSGIGRLIRRIKKKHRARQESRQQMQNSIPIHRKE